MDLPKTYRHNRGGISFPNHSNLNPLPKLKNSALIPVYLYSNKQVRRMADSQKNSNAVDLLPEIVDLDELLRLLCGAANEDVCMRGLTVSLLQAKQLSGDLRQRLEQLATEQTTER